MHDYYGDPDRAEYLEYGEDTVIRPSTTVITILPTFNNQSARYEAPTALQKVGLVHLG